MRLFTTDFTPFTAWTAVSAAAFDASSATWPLSVTTPSFTSTETPEIVLTAVFTDSAMAESLGLHAATRNRKPDNTRRFLNRLTFFINFYL